MTKHILWLALIAAAAAGCGKRHPSYVSVGAANAVETVPGPRPVSPPISVPGLAVPEASAAPTP